MSVNVSALKIHMSESAHEALTAFPGFITERRGNVSVKVCLEIVFHLHILKTRPVRDTAASMSTNATITKRMYT